jgi:TIR domain
MAVRQNGDVTSRPTDLVSDDAAPRVFISHASEDKERFVLPFAQDLRAEGVNAWVDQWAMLPGDSLVRKIFTEGLDNAVAVVVVLSRVSTTKPWVAEELDAAVVKRINDDSKLIPIVLDNLDVKTDVPAAVRHLLLEIVPDSSERATVVRRVVRSIFGTVERPPLGPPPLFADALAVRIPGLDRIDSLVLRLAGSEAVRDFGDQFDTAEFVETITDAQGVTDAEAIESLEVLEAEQYIEIRRTMGAGLAGMRRFTITPYGLEIYLRAYEVDYPRFEQTVIARIAERSSGDQGTERELASSVDVAPMIVRHVLDMLASTGDLSLSKPHGGSQGWRFHNVSPRLRRRSGH